MANQNSSIEEILAACRAADGGGGGATPAAPTPANAAPDAPAAPATPPAPAAPAAGGGAKPSQSMSVAEMMAAARGEVAGGGAAATPPADDPPAAAAAPAAGGKKPSQSMSVAEMMAAARGETAKGSPAAKKPAAAPGAAKAPAAAASAPAKKANPNAAVAATGPRDTSSILAAARKADGDRRGPMSRAEAAEKGKAPTKKVAAPPMPEKPAYAKPKPAPVATDEDRRGFMSIIFGSFMALGFVCLSLVGGLWGLGLARFLFPNILTEPPSQFKIGFPADFPPDSVITKFKAQFGVWVVNTEYEGQRQITALMSVCTHLGCTPNWLEGEQKFKCPCHGSGFYKEGINFEGPAPRPLERYAIRIADDGQLEIDKSKQFQQEMGDWKDPACYVPV